MFNFADDRKISKAEHTAYLNQQGRLRNMLTSTQIARMGDELFGRADRSPKDEYLVQEEVKRVFNGMDKNSKYRNRSKHGLLV